MKTETDLEAQIAAAARKGVADAVSAALSGYKSPLSLLAAAVVERRSDALEALIGGALDKAIAEAEFKAAVLAAIRTKFARVLVSKLGGEIERRVNELKSRPETRARLTLALGKLLDEVVGGKS